MRGLLKTKPAITQILLFISIALVSFFVLGLLGTTLLSVITKLPISELADMSKWDFNDPRIVTFIRGSQVVQLVSLFIVPVFLCARLFSTDSKKYLGLKKSSNAGYYMAGIGIMLLSIPLITWLGEINRNVQFPAGIESWFKEKETEAAKTIEALLSKHTIKDLLLNLVCVAGIAAVGEELLFRGIAQRLFIKLFKSPWAGIITAAFIFSAIHMQFYGFIPRFVLGIFLGVIYWYSGSLWTAMVAHFVYDATLIVLAYYNPEMIADSETPVKFSNLGLMAAVSLGIVFLIIAWMKMKSVTTYSNVYADDDIPVKDHPF